MSNNQHFFIFAGEHSGDLHGSHLIKALKENDPTLTFEGVCGPRMRALEVPSVVNMEEFEVMGLTDVLLAFPRIYKNFYKIRDYILRTLPQVVVLIDYPGFNLRLATRLRRQGYAGKIIQYVSPSVWAWGKERIETMAKSLDLLLVIYPFETEYFKNTPLKTIYVGNPLLEYIRDYNYDHEWQSKTGISASDSLIALFPGSRYGEIKRNLPILLETALCLWKKQPEIQIAISCANQQANELLKKHLATTPASFRTNIFLIPKQYTYELMRDSRTAIAKSGTVMLELALHRRPSITIYNLTTLNRLYAKYILKLKLPYYCIVNILSNKQVFPEFIENRITAHDLSQELEQLNKDGHIRTACLNACDDLQRIFGNANASTVAANSILELLSC